MTAQVRSCTLPERLAGGSPLSSSSEAEASPSNASEGSSAWTEDASPLAGESPRASKRRGRVLVLSALCLSCASCGIGWAARAVWQQRGPSLRGEEPIPGVRLQPSQQALPALPAMPAALPALSSEGGQLAAVSSGDARRYSQPAIVFGMLIRNINYERLMEASNIYAVLRATIRQAVASEAGIGVETEDVQLVVSPDVGGVIVECTIRAADDEVAGDVQLRIEASSRLREELELNLRAVSEMSVWEQVAAGRIEVASIGEPVVYGTHEPTTVTSTTEGPTTTTKPLPPTTTKRDCNDRGGVCFVHSQCCSGRCGRLHKCLATMSGFAI